MSRPQIKIYEVFEKSGPKALKRTIKIIGESIIKGSTYPPLRAHAAGLSTKAESKDYLGQVQQIFDDFTKKKWRYVHDPLYTELVSGDGNASWNVVWGAGARSGERGHGDCDDATAALGAALLSVGFPVRIATCNKPGSPTLFTHVYPQTFIKPFGWITVDAVGYPLHNMGWNPPSDRTAIWDLKGNLITKQGNFPKSFQEMLGGDEMTNEFQDYDLTRYGFAGSDPESGIADWDSVGLFGFGAYEPVYGMIGETNLMAETDESDTVGGTGLVRSKMLEMSPKDYFQIKMFGVPSRGALALGDDGDVYQWTGGDQYTGLGGFFKKLFKRVASRVKKVFKKIGSVARKIIKKIPGGKYLIKLHDKIKKITMKIVKPLVKFVGKYAAKLAPVAAIIPGWGPAIAAALKTSGKIANVLQETGVLQDEKTGKLKFKSGQQAKLLKARLNEEAEKIHRSGTVRQAGGRLIKKGSREHQAALQGLGLEIAA